MELKVEVGKGSVLVEVEVLVVAKIVAVVAGEAEGRGEVTIAMSALE